MPLKSFLIQKVTIKSRQSDPTDTKSQPMGKLSCVCGTIHPCLEVKCRLQQLCHMLPPGLSGSKRTSETGREESSGQDPCVCLFLDPGRGQHGQRVHCCGVPTDKGSEPHGYCSPRSHGQFLETTQMFKYIPG